MKQNPIIQVVIPLVLMGVLAYGAMLRGLTFLDFRQVSTKGVKWGVEGVANIWL